MLHVLIRPRRAGTELLELTIHAGADNDEPVANLIFSPFQDRQGRDLLSVRDQNTFSETLRKKRLMSLVHLWLIHRYDAAAVHYVTPTEDNRYQAERMKAHGLFEAVKVTGDVIVADVDRKQVEQLLAADRGALDKLIRKEG